MKVMYRTMDELNIKFVENDGLGIVFWLVASSRLPVTLALWRHEVWDRSPRQTLTNFVHSFISLLSRLLKNGIDAEYIFDPKYIDDLDFSHCSCQYNPAISPQHPGESLILRPLSSDDYDKGFLHLLTHLTKVGEISRQQFTDCFNVMKSCPNSYYVIVIEDTRSEEVIGAATLFVEQKFIHQTATRGRIEDVVVNDQYRGKQLGKLLVDTLVLLSKRIGCYKLTLDCKDKMVKFYEQFGFGVESGNSNCMVIRFRD